MGEATSVFSLITLCLITFLQNRADDIYLVN
jgi:hypothetical protein